MLSMQEMSDRMEIQDLMVRYAYAIDDRDFDKLDSVFTDDAIIDYSEAGGAKGSLEDIKKYLPDAMKAFPGFQHLSACTEIKLDGDTAETRTILFNPMVHGEGKDQSVFFIGLWYEDKLRRTEDGWRIASRRERMSWVHNAPEGMMPD